MAPVAKTTNARYARLLIARFADTPEKLQAVLDGSGVPPEHLDFEFLTVAEYEALFLQLSKLAGGDFIVAAADLWGLGSHGLLSLAIQSAANLDAALRSIITFGGDGDPPFTFELALQDWTASVQVRTDEDMAPFNRRNTSELVFVGLKAVLCLFPGVEPARISYCFDCPPPAYAAKVRQTLGGRVTYGQRVARVEFPKAWLAKPSPLRNAANFHLAQTQLAADVDRRQPGRPVAAAVSRLLAAVEDSRAPLSRVAAKLGVSERTLVRRLREEDTSFRDLVDIERERRSERLLAEPGVKLADVADRLGYSDAASFARARRRWARRGDSATTQAGIRKLAS